MNNRSDCHLWQCAERNRLHESNRIAIEKVVEERRKVLADAAADAEKRARELVGNAVQGIKDGVNTVVNGFARGEKAIRGAIGGLFFTTSLPTLF